MADAEKEQERLKLQRKRELRRRKLLQNANSRMEKLKGVVQSSPADATTASDEAFQELEAASLLLKDAPDPLSPVPDPPDELIERHVPHTTQRPPPPPPPPPSQPRGHSLLSVLVATAQSTRWLMIRTILSAITALCCALSIHSAAITTLSPISCMVLLDSFLLAVIALSASSRPPPPSPLGRLAVVKLTLFYMLPSLASSFETLCLSAFLGAIVLQDLCTCMFFSVISIAAFSLFIS